MCCGVAVSSIGFQLEKKGSKITFPNLKLLVKSLIKDHNINSVICSSVGSLVSPWLGLMRYKLQLMRQQLTVVMPG